MTDMQFAIAMCGLIVSWVCIGFVVIRILER